MSFEKNSHYEKKSRDISQEEFLTLLEGLEDDDWETKIGFDDAPKKTEIPDGKVRFLSNSQEQPGYFLTGISCVDPANDSVKFGTDTMAPFLSANLSNQDTKEAYLRVCDKFLEEYQNSITEACLARFYKKVKQGVPLVVIKGSGYTFNHGAPFVRKAKNIFPGNISVSYRHVDPNPLSSDHIPAPKEPHTEYIPILDQDMVRDELGEVFLKHKEEASVFAGQLNYQQEEDILAKFAQRDIIISEIMESGLLPGDGRFREFSYKKDLKPEDPMFAFYFPGSGNAISATIDVSGVFDTETHSIVCEKREFEIDGVWTQRVGTGGRDGYRGKGSIEMKVRDTRSGKEVFFVDVSADKKESTEIKNLFGSVGAEEYGKRSGYFLSDEVDQERLDDFFEQSLALENEVKDSIRNSPDFLRDYYEKAINDSAVVVLKEYPNLSNTIKDHVRLREFPSYEARNYIQEFKDIVDSDPEISRSRLEKEISEYRQRIRDYVLRFLEKNTKVTGRFEKLSEDGDSLLEEGEGFFDERDVKIKRVYWEELKQTYAARVKSDPSDVLGVLGQMSSFCQNLKNNLEPLKNKKDSVSGASDNFTEDREVVNAPSTPEAWSPQDKNSILKNSELWVVPGKYLSENSAKFVTGLRRSWIDGAAGQGSSSGKDIWGPKQHADIEEAWKNISSEELPNIDALSGFLGAYWSDKFYKRLARGRQDDFVEVVDESLAVADVYLAELSKDSEFSEIVFGLCRNRKKYKIFIEQLVQYILRTKKTIDREWVDEFLLENMD